MILQAPKITPELREKVDGFLKKPKLLFIDGDWQEASNGEVFTTHDPATGEELAQVARGSSIDVDLAVEAARRALEQGPWSTTTPAERTRKLNLLADLLEKHGDEFALIETLDNGKPFAAARGFDVRLSIECLRYNAGWATRLTGETIPVSLPGEWHCFTVREPVGVAALIVPWNVPLAIAISKLAPALAAGCTVILKPAEQTPLSAIRLTELVNEAGFPEGVVNVITGYGHEAGAALVDHPGVDKISFTGSTRVGQTILSAAGNNMKRVSLELGGKSPVVIFSDADLDMAIQSAAMGIFGNTGQVCAAGSRLFVEESVMDQVVEGIAAKAKSLVLGPGTSPDVDLGPLISQTQLDKVMGYIEDGSSAGARIVTGGSKLPGKGYFVEPTVFVDTRPDMPIAKEEIFGPVLCATPFNGDNIDRIALAANYTDFGLSSTIWTNDFSKAHRLARRIRAGVVKINAPSALDQALPFGGMKQSGWGRENGRFGAEAFTELKTIAAKLA